MFQQYRGLIALGILAAGIGFGVFQLFQPSAPETPSITEAAPVIAPVPSATAPADEVPTPEPEVATLETPSVKSGSGVTAASASGDFAYFIVALSWSPTYCLEQADQSRDRRQCAAARPYSFVLHGLWPQNERGYPENCPTDDPRVPEAIIDTVMDITPSKGLIGHEWRKHGTCTGLSQAAYFAAARTAFNQIRVPEKFTNISSYISTSPSAVEQAFVQANPGLTKDSVRITCSRKHLREVQVCMTKDFKFRTCGRDVQSDCDQATIAMPPTRGG